MSDSRRRPLRIVRAWTLLEDGLLVASLSVMVLLAVGQIVLRNIFHTSLEWADPVLRYLVLWVGMIGAMVATREYNHINIDVLSHLTKGRTRATIRVLTDLFTAGVTGTLAYAAVVFLQYEKEGGQIAFGNVPTWVAELILPVAFGTIAIRYGVFTIVHAVAAIKGEEEPEGGTEAAP